MSLSAPDYRKLYIQQDKAMALLAPYLKGCYLTGGTALGRFYLHHRYSDDLDFFLNGSSEFKKRTQEIFGILKANYPIDETVTTLSDDFVRIMLVTIETPLKIEFVNDVTYRWGETKLTEKKITIDNVANILANKLTALLSRDEPKDVFDILTISCSYSFNWKDVYRHAFEKQIISETDVIMRLQSFPAELFATQTWLMHPVDTADLKEKLEIITDDFLFAKDNSLGIGKTHILNAIPVMK